MPVFHFRKTPNYMHKRLFFLGFFAILIFTLLLRIIPAINNNFLFTMDQANDAVNVREILTRHIIPLHGPMTSIEGFFNGPIWYWFLSVGYAATDGHPFGGLFLLMLFNTAIVGYTMWIVKKYVSPRQALCIGASFIFFWPLYDASRYAFNPFPLVGFARLLIFFLVEALCGNERMFILAALPVGLAAHTEIASFFPLALLYGGTGLGMVLKHYLKPRYFVISIAFVLLLFLPYGISELQTNFSQMHSIYKHAQSSRSFFSGTQFTTISWVTLNLIAEGIIPKQPVLSALLFFPLVGFVLWKGPKAKRRERFLYFFTVLSVVLFFLTWLWFSVNTGWHGWHTVYIPPLIFLLTLLILFSLRKIFTIPLLVLILVAQFSTFAQQYSIFFRSSDDPSLLVNELGVIDWVYQESGGQGFYVYAYLPSVYDYPYQYLFWWYGRKQYGFVPCEYSTYPGTPDLFVPGVKYYQEPKKPCGLYRFLIIEPDSNTGLQNEWLEGVRAKTTLVKETHIGKIMLEKRKQTEK